MTEGALVCEIDRCGKAGAIACAGCGRMACGQHIVANFDYLPGGQRPYCLECDAERRRLYQTVRGQGLRSVLWSGAGALVGSIAGYGAGILATSDSFTHIVSTDIGFLAGLALGLFWAIRGPHRNRAD